MAIEEILSSPIVENTLEGVFHKKPFHIIERPGSFVIILKEEPADRVTRLIILKPNGYTANHPQELSSHPEAREATLEIKGAVGAGKKGYNLIKNCVEFVYYPTRQAETISSFPYAKADNALRLVKNSRTKFKVIKSSGYGFYHNLRNLTDRWLVLVLNKKLDLSKEIDYGLLDACSGEEKRALLEFHGLVTEKGDMIFKENRTAIEKITSLSPKRCLPVLITFLNMPELGKHEQCTVFAVILKMAKLDKRLALGLLSDALAKNTAQPYYLNELIEKIS